MRVLRVPAQVTQFVADVVHVAHLLLHLEQTDDPVFGSKYPDRHAQLVPLKVLNLVLESQDPQLEADVEHVKQVAVQALHNILVPSS